jgi:hypothetical protein
LQRLWQVIEGKPAVSGIFTAAVCGLVVVGNVHRGQSPAGIATRFTNNEPAKQEAPASLFVEIHRGQLVCRQQYQSYGGLAKLLVQ